MSEENAEKREGANPLWEYALVDVWRCVHCGYAEFGTRMADDLKTECRGCAELESLRAKVAELERMDELTRRALGANSQPHIPTDDAARTWVEASKHDTKRALAAEARGREVEKDRERLDWLAAHPEMLVWNNGSYCGVTDTGYDDEPTNPKRHLALSCETIRDAIDMAKDPDRNRPLVRRAALAREESEE